MEPIFREDETEGFGYGAHSASLPGQYPERNHHRVAESSRLARYSRPSDFGGRIGSSYQLGPRNARGDFPGGHRMDRVASMNQAQDSNDDDGETSSASEDSTVSIGYPSPQARAQRSAKRAEPCAEIRLPPSQRARLQPKETEPTLHTGWSPAESSPSTHESRRQLPRLAALEVVPHKPHQAQELNQKHLPTSVHQQHSSPQHSLQHGRMGSGSSPVIPQMQLPSLVGSGRPDVVSSSAVPAAHSTATSTPSPHTTMLRAVQHKQGSSVDHLRLPAPLNPQAVYEGWSHSDARQVPRTDSSAPAPAPATPAERMVTMSVTGMPEHARGQRQWDTMWPPSNAYTGLTMERSAYGLDPRYDSQHENENGWIIQQGRTVANAAFGWAKAGGRQDSSQVMLARQGGSFAHQQPHQRQPNQIQEREQRQPFLPHRQQQTEARYPGQTMQPQVSRRREVARTPSPVYGTPPPQSSPGYQPSGSKNPEQPRSGGWGAEEGGAADSLGGEWAIGVPRPASGNAGKQILQLCLNHLNPKASREVWSHDEEEVLWRAQKEYGNAWSYIAGLLPGRSENAVKNHWYTQMRMFIGQRHAAGGKPPTGGGVSGETFNVGTEGGGASKLVRHSRTYRRGDDRAEEARRSVGAPCSTSSSDPRAKKDDAAAARAENEARAEAVAALNLLFSQGERCGSPSATDVEMRPASPLQQQQRREARGSDSPRGRLPVFNARRDSS